VADASAAGRTTASRPEWTGFVRRRRRARISPDRQPGALRPGSIPDPEDDLTQEEAPPAPHLRRSYRYYDLVMASFVTVLLCANVIGAAKVAQLGPFTFGAGVLFFPISYVFGDVLTEVYGYARARKVVWAGFGALAFASFMSAVVLAFPPAPGWPHQAAYETVFGSTPRIVLASLVAYFCGEFCNSYVLARMKVGTGGRFLWMRTIGSTIVGEAVDSAVFYPVAFLGAWSGDLLVRVMLSNYAIKVLWEAVMTPVTYRIVSFLKRAEREDYFDRHTNFTPFSLET
jgi:uncharacterized integral membrane protein (TIGR00697 family)